MDSDELTQQQDGPAVLPSGPMPMRIACRGSGPVVEAQEPLPTLTATAVRAVLESVRR
jgi:hypothetical protein